MSVPDPPGTSRLEGDWVTSAHVTGGITITGDAAVIITLGTEHPNPVHWLIPADRALDIAEQLTHWSARARTRTHRHRMHPDA